MAFFRSIYFICIACCLHACLCTACVQCPKRPEEGVGSRLGVGKPGFLLGHLFHPIHCVSIIFIDIRLCLAEKQRALFFSLNMWGSLFTGRLAILREQTPAWTSSSQVQLRHSVPRAVTGFRFESLVSKPVPGCFKGCC